MVDDAMDVEAPHSSFGMDLEPSAVDTAPINHAAIAEARRVVVSFLRDHQTEEVVPDNSRVVILDSSLPLCHAFRALLENGIRAAPVVDVHTYNFTGMFTVSDVIDCLRHFYYNQPEHNIMRGLDEYTLASWRSISESPDVHAGFRYADAESSLFDACRMLRDHRIHRLPILSNKNLLLCTLEHWRVLQFVHEHLGGYDVHRAPPATDLFNLTLSQLRIGTYSGIVTVRQTDSLLHVLETLHTRHLSAVPVVDESLTLSNVYSRTDITVLGKNTANINLDQSVMEALSLVRAHDFRVHTCRRSDTLRYIFEWFESTRKHRLYVVSERGFIEGVLSLSDLLAYFLEGF